MVAHIRAPKIISDGPYQIGGVVIITAQGALQNVTASAAILTSGTLDDARLSVNVPRLNVPQTWSAAQSFSAAEAATLTHSTGRLNFTPGGVTRRGYIQQGTTEIVHATEGGANLRFSLVGPMLIGTTVTGGAGANEVVLAPGKAIRGVSTDGINTLPLLRIRGSGFNHSVLSLNGGPLYLESAATSAGAAAGGGAAVPGTVLGFWNVLVDNTPARIALFSPAA